MKQNKYSYGIWMESLSLGKTPNGEIVQVVELVPSGTEIEVIVSGHQNFGSGGFRANTTFAGTEPANVEVLGTESDDFTSRTTAKVTVSLGSIISQVCGDCIGAGRMHRRVWICTGGDSFTVRRSAFHSQTIHH